MRGIEVFLRDQRKAIAEIARASRGIIDKDDLAQEAFLIAIEIEAKTHCTLDLELPADQSVLLRWMYSEYVKFAPRSRLRSTSLDAGWNDDTDEPSLGDRIAAMLAGRETDNPLVSAEVAEDHAEEIARVQTSYSEASAYTLLLIRWAWDFRALAVDLCLGETATLKERVRRAADLAHHQPTLFDGVERINPEFEPRRERGTRRSRTAMKRWIDQWKATQRANVPITA